MDSLWMLSFPEVDIMKLNHWLDQTDGCWWFQHPDPSEGPIGPYDTKREMLEDKAGVERTTETKTWQEIMKGPLLWK